MGVVYLAEDPRHDRRAAIKLLAPHLSTDPQARRRLLAEARAASRLDHPNICEILEVSETDDGLLYLAMPYYEGETVAQRLAHGPLPLEQALQIALQAAAGLERAHAAGVIHRDIKPSNLLLARDGSLKILDFGVAKMHGASLSAPGVRVGTLAYMAPEQLLGRPSARRRSVGARRDAVRDDRRAAALSGRVRAGGDVRDSQRGTAADALGPPRAAGRADRLLATLLDKSASRRLSSAAEPSRSCRPWSAARRSRSVRRTTEHSASAHQVFGREREIEQLERILERARLATITGPGGRARRGWRSGRAPVGAEVSSRVWYVSFELAQGAEQAAALLARALGLDQPGAPPSRSRRPCARKSAAGARQLRAHSRLRTAARPPARRLPGPEDPCHQPRSIAHRRGARAQRAAAGDAAA